MYSLGVDEIKTRIYARLANENPGPGYVHHPLTEEFDEEYFDQLTSEKVVVRFVKGSPKREWVQTRKRNEALDCDVYAEACQLLLKPNYEALEKRLGESESDAEPESTEGRTGRRRPARSTGGFVNGWRK